MSKKFVSLEKNATFANKMQLVMQANFITVWIYDENKKDRY